MKKTTLLLSLSLLISCQSNESEWFLIQNDDVMSIAPPFGYSSGYINKQGDIVVPLNKYGRCFTDNVKHYAVVYDKKRGGLIGIDLNENKLFNAVWNGEGGPVDEHEGMRLIVENDKYGFVNNRGKIIIKPQYKCADSFINGKAKVSNDCFKVNRDKEKRRWKMNTWVFIDNVGREIK